MKYEEGLDTKTLYRTKSDYRAGTVCAGAAYQKMARTGVIYEVSGFSKELGLLGDVEIATVGTAYDILEMRETDILVYGQTLYFGKSLKTSLALPNQMHVTGLIVDDVPKQFSNRKSIHGIYIPTEKLLVPFRMRGCMSHFETGLPTEEEM